MATATFGQRGAMKNSPMAPRTPSGQTPPQTPNVSSPFLALLDRLLLWLPDDRSPGLPAIAVVVVRQAVLPFLFCIVPLVIVALAATQLPQLMNNGGFRYCEIGALFGCISLVQELNRYAFTRRADEVVKALMIITALEIAIGLLFNHSRLYTMGWRATEQIAASVALFFGLKHRRYIVPIVGLIVAGHITIDLTAPQFFAPPDAKSAPPLQMSASVTPPKVDHMQSWAKLYPGSIVTSVETSNILGLTSWQVDYTTHSSPEQIRAFYQSVATDRGFTEPQTFGPLQYFTQPRTRDEFHFMIIPNSSETQVVYTAQSFSQK